MIFAIVLSRRWAGTGLIRTVFAAICGLAFACASRAATAPSGASAEVGKELKALETDVKQPTKPSVAPPKGLLKMADEADPVAGKAPQNGNKRADSKADEAGRKISSVQMIGDISLLKEITLWDLAEDYVDGIGDGINALLGIRIEGVASNRVAGIRYEEPRTRKERIAAVPEKIEECVKKLGLEMPKGASIGRWRSFAEGLTLYDMLRKEIEGKTLDIQRIESIVSRYQAALVGRGYYMASLVTVPDRMAEGVVLIEVDQGRMGRLRLYTKDSKELGADKRKPYTGRFFTADQIRRKMSDFSYGRRFDYFELYRALYAINSHPDLLVDANLVMARPDASYSPPRRYADMDLYIEERFPLHAVLSVGNTGTKATGDWRPSLTLQHLNLTHHDDVLTLSAGPFSDDLDSLKSFGANYYFPYSWDKGGAVTLYGGYSDLDAEEVVPGIAVKGSGWFAGAQVMHRVWSSRRSVTSVGFGLTYRYIEDNLILKESGEADFPLMDRPLTLVPLSLMASHSSLAPDRLGGRNFFTLQWIAHFGGLLDASTRDEFEAVRPDANPDYHILRVQAARLQPVFGEAILSDDGRRKERKNEWLVFLRGDAQWASDVLVPVEQKAVGGMDTVRGFPERVLMGDHGISGTAELRTPVYLSSWIGRLRRSERRFSETTQGIQFVSFADAGAAWLINDPDPDNPDTLTVASVGLGLRLLIGQTAQVRFDWGIPIYGRDDVDELTQEKVRPGGRYHLSAQIQF